MEELTFDTSESEKKWNNKLNNFFFPINLLFYSTQMINKFFHESQNQQNQFCNKEKSSEKIK